VSLNLIDEVGVAIYRRTFRSVLARMPPAGLRPAARPTLVSFGSRWARARVSA